MPLRTTCPPPAQDDIAAKLARIELRLAEIAELLATGLKQTGAVKKKAA